MTMTQTEALRLALEAMEDRFNQMKWHKAITAIAEALALPEEESFLVATIGNWGRVEWVDGVFPSLGDKMYSAPPQRTWVGLTDEERNHARQSVTYSQLAMTASEWTEAVQIETEKRLKEKNK